MSHSSRLGADRVSRTLASNRLGVPAVVFFVLSAATPLTVVAGVVTTGFAVTGVAAALGLLLARAAKGTRASRSAHTADSAQPADSARPVESVHTSTKEGTRS